ncbi:hypothetical protein GGR21_003964 [Dysgonomonas hofstadii]|uniref:Lipoprotein n=1 Tax=Dysgonomonas hofstadii TaxID=637886 RepID=A0A840CPL4_9BACT|nr:hypothetical protein [Dysgonomonas hofstadii]MBB4038037.1 hypothetical protein [Dysgonomonas hofstadii]
MKIIYKIGILILSISMTISLWNCAGTNDDYIFVHDTNTISQMICKASHSGSDFRGEIYEFNADGEMIEGTFTQEDVEGGYGLILFAISKSLENDVDLSNIYLVATVTYDEIITPSLSGRHDITGDGIIITVKSGVGTIRQYRVRGYYE